MVDGAVRLLGAGGASAVVVLAAAGVGAVLVVRLLARLDRGVAGQLVLAGLLLAVAVLVVDGLGPSGVDEAGRAQGGYVARAVVEELMELVAGLLALDAVLRAALRGEPVRR